MENSRSVSYTHLDVYKRQAEYYGGDIKESARILLKDKSAWERRILCNIEDRQRMFPVSYTHLDVYKRQENDNVIRPAILWNDGRTQKETDYLNNVIGKEKLSELTGNIAFRCV